MNSECDRDPLPIATSCREQSSLLQKTRNEGIAMGILTPSLSTHLILVVARWYGNLVSGLNGLLPKLAINNVDIGGLS